MRLYDVNEKVIGTWEYLIRVRGSELRSLPADVDDVGDHPHLTQEQRWLIGWWLSRSSSYPCRRASSWKTRDPSAQYFWCQKVRDRLAQQVESIRHWKAEVTQLRPDTWTTRRPWFVDPPYQGKVGGALRPSVQRPRPAGGVVSIPVGAGDRVRAPRGRMAPVPSAGTDRTTELSGDGLDRLIEMAS